MKEDSDHKRLRELLSLLPTKKSLAEAATYCQWCGTESPEVLNYLSGGIQVPLYCCKFCSDNEKRTLICRTEEDLKASWRKKALERKNSNND
jgi:hypothetical protein